MQCKKGSQTFFILTVFVVLKNWNTR